VEEKNRCPLFRKPESLSVVKGIGYCDIGGDSTLCKGDVEFCEKPDALRRYRQRELNNFEDEKENS